MNKLLKVFTGNANPELVESTCQYLDASQGKIKVENFSDGEANIELLENVRGNDIFVLQSTSPPTNDHLMELVFIVDALKRAHAGRITAVIPYFGYARQDRRVRSSRVPISAKVVADVICNAGVDRILTIDLHSEQIQGFFAVPVDNLYAAPIFIQDILRQNYANPIVVSPDIGGVVRARSVAKDIHCDLSIIDKRRPEANKSEIMSVIGEVKDRTCILIDDIIDTAGTLCKAVDELKGRGAKAVVAYCCHPVLSGDAVASITASGLDELIVSDSISLSKEASACSKIRVVSLAELLSKAMRRINNDQSLRPLFEVNQSAD